MNKVAQEKERFVKEVATSPASSFYKELWGSEGAFETLPILTLQQLAHTPLPKRRYVNGSGITKVVRRGGNTFLSEWLTTHTAQEELGPVGARTLVYMSSAHEAMEKGMWCYAHNSLPLVGEKDPLLAARTARVAQVDTVIVDSASLQKLLPHLAECAPLTHLVVLDHVFDSRVLSAAAQYAQHVTLTLTLPETGAFASAPLQTDLVFTLHDACILETDERTLLTKVRPLVTPIIRYDIGVRLRTEGAKVMLGV